MAKTQAPIPWNKGRSVGQKEPLTLEQARCVRDYLCDEGRLRDLALFATAFDTMLRAVDLLKLRVDDVRRIDGSIRKEFNIRQQKTGYGNLVGLTRYTQQVLEFWIDEADLGAEDPLFINLRSAIHRPISSDQYRKLVKHWVAAIGLDPRDYSSHSLRRSKAVMVHEESRKIEAVRRLLGQQSVQSTQVYLGVAQKAALAMGRKFEL